jgi:hypothetical protein
MKSFCRTELDPGYVGFNLDENIVMLQKNQKIPFDCKMTFCRTELGSEYVGFNLNENIVALQEEKKTNKSFHMIARRPSAELNCI